MVYHTARASTLPIIGMGGIFKPEDAIQFFLVGADAVQVGTLNFIDPAGSLEILEGIRTYCVDKKIKCIKDLVGTVDMPR
jgi:dihydroorotate dehydrogenase (NAD+) catalytic subunit